MSWKFGPFTVATDDVVDVDTINDCFLSVIEEASGELNEHNFAAGGFPDRTLWAEDIGLRIHHAPRSTNPSSAAASTFSTPDDIPSSVKWAPFGNSFEKTVTTNGGDLWIIASFQIDIAGTFGALFALEIDGTVLGESFLGTGDIDNDQVAGTSYLGADFTTGPAPTIWLPLWGAIVLEAIVPVGPGTYVIRPVIRNPKIGNTVRQVVASYELIVIEMR